ncbi:MAG: phenylacetate--CoA ligase family protein [Candidatus Zixiibacteriota bacterium]|jgi:phenylacetate-CoA ligase
MPDLLQPIARHLIFPLQSWYEGSSAPRYLREMEKTQYLSPSELKELQAKRLRKLLRHAYQNCSFYKQRFDRCGFHPDNFSGADDLLKIPVLTKEDIQQHKEEMKAQNFAESDLIPNKTGGSTGRPLYFYLDKERSFSRKAATFRHNRWAGWEIGMKTAAIWGHREDIAGLAGLKSKIRNFLLDRRIILDTSSITREKLVSFKAELKAYRPDVYIAYANSMYLFARFLNETGSQDHHRPRSIITSAEVLEAQQRALIEKVFDCRVFDRYGSRETSVIASECSSHKGLHIGAEAFMVEFVKDGKPVAPGELGKIIITDLLNSGMPFIRYQIEDVGIPAGEVCTCGRGLPLMKMAAGRMTDFLVTPEGKLISGASLTIYLIANAPGVAQAQLIQETVNRVVFRIVRGDGFGENSLAFFEREIPRFFGPSVKYEIEFVENIPVESSGKYRFSISKVDPAEMF